MTDDLAYRRIQSADIPFVANLERVSYPIPWTRERIRAERHQWHGAGWIVEDDERPVGYVFYRQLPRSLDVVRLAVAPRYRRLRIGSDILRRLMAKLGNGRNTMRLWLSIDNVEAMGCAVAAGMQIRVLRRANGQPASGVMAWCGRPIEVRRQSCR